MTALMLTRLSENKWILFGHFKPEENRFYGRKFRLGILDFERFRSLVDLSGPCHFKLNRN